MTVERDTATEAPIVTAEGQLHLTLHIMESIRNRIEELSPQLDSFWDEHAHPFLNQLAIYAPIIIPTFVVYHHNAPFLLKVTYLLLV